jgi:NADH:ubiquinone reductase (H+-translocating)
MIDFAEFARIWKRAYPGAFRGDHMETSTAKKRILILGGGFAGAYTALHLEKRLGGRKDVEVKLIAKENFVLFTPMLSEVAGGDVEVTDIVYSLRMMLRHTQVTIAEVEAIDLAKKQVRIVQSGSSNANDVSYDQLVLALGAVTNFYGNPGLEKHALTMKTLGDAILVRNRAIDALGLADNQADETERKTILTMVITGGGFAGVETAGAVNDLMREAMKFYPNVNENMLRIVVVHAGDALLPELSESLGRYAEKQLARRGVEVLLNTKVTSYDGMEVTLGDGTKIATRTLVWTAGITPPPLLSTLPCAIERGRVLANECLQVPNWPGVWALGDCALVPDPFNPGKFYPPTAQHATREAAVLANNIVASMRGQAPKPFKFKIIGLLAVIGRRTGVAEIFGVRFSGLVAWWLWRCIYLSKLPGLQKKVRVTLDWILDVIFSKDLVELPTLRATTISQAEHSSYYSRASGN